MTLQSTMASTTQWAPENTPNGKLPPFEIAKAFAYKEVIEAMEEHLDKTCWELLGVGKAQFTAQHLTVEGGGHPTIRAVKLWWEKDQDDEPWHPGKRLKNAAGAPVQISLAQKKTIAAKAMDLKKDYISPTPEAIRVCLPGTTTNKKRDQQPISDESIRRIFKTLCYDEKEDDPWQYLNSPQQDCLTTEMMPGRVKTADHVLAHVTPNQAWNFVAIDPCFSLLPKTQAKADLQKIAAMGTKKYMSPKSKRKTPNLRAPHTAKTQKKDCRVVHWTPVFTRGQVKLVVLTDCKSLCNMSAVASFVKDKLPGVLEDMKQEFGWSNVPRVVLHDKASYFVDTAQNRMNRTFAAGLKAGGFTTWMDIGDAGTKWLSAHLGDLYLHETVVSHVRRLQAGKFTRKNLVNETPEQFASRMAQIEQYLNYELGDDGAALQRLGRELHDRCATLKKLKGQRIPK